MSDLEKPFSTDLKKLLKDAENHVHSVESIMMGIPQKLGRRAELEAKQASDDAQKTVLELLEVLKVIKERAGSADKVYSLAKAALIKYQPK